MVSAVTLFILSTNSPTFNTAKIWFIPLSLIVGILSVVWILDYFIDVTINVIKERKNRRRRR
jgi:hypothetical protein